MLRRGQRHDSNVSQIIEIKQVKKRISLHDGSKQAFLSPSFFIGRISPSRSSFAVEKAGHALFAPQACGHKEVAETRSESTDTMHRICKDPRLSEVRCLSFPCAVLRRVLVLFLFLHNIHSPLYRPGRIYAHCFCRRKQRIGEEERQQPFDGDSSLLYFVFTHFPSLNTAKRVIPTVFLDV